MKKTLSAVLTLLLVFSAMSALAAGNVTINTANFPDNVFRSYISDHFDTDGNGILSAAEITSVKEINLSDPEGGSVSNLTGIGYFTKLTSLDVSGNKLTTLDISKNTVLKHLNCSDNKLTTLTIGTRSTKLIEISCYNNKFRTLDTGNAKNLKWLNCNGNTRLTTLNTLKNKKLVGLSCSNTKLSTLDISKNTKLTMLECDQNSRLRKLDIKGCRNLIRYFRTGEVSKTNINIEWVVEAEERITIPRRCKLYNGSTVLYNGR